MLVICVMVAVDELDLSLLASLDALLTERHVTRAARRLGVTQSSMSHSLARLRAALGDPLLVRVGRAMVPTPRAEAMEAPLREALAALRRVVSDAGGFDPGRSARGFTLACPDLLAPVIPELLRALAAEAPGVSLQVVARSGDTLAALASGGCDVALGPRPSKAPGLVMRPLGSLSWCVLARRGHPGVRRRLTAEAWARYPHVVVRSGDASPNRVAQAIAGAGVARAVGVTLPGSLAAAWTVSKSDMLFTAPRELVGELAEALDLRVMTPPAALPPVAVAALWHERMHADAGHRWFRELTVAVMQRRLRASRRG